MTWFRLTTIHKLTLLIWDRYIDVERCYTCQLWTEFYFKYSNYVLSTHADSVILVSLIILNKPPTHNSPLHLPLSRFNPPLHHHPSLSQRPVPLCHSHCCSSGLQCVGAGDTEAIPPPSRPAVCCDSAMSAPPLSMMSGCPLEEVTIFFLSCSVSLCPLTPRLSGLCNDWFVTAWGEVEGFLICSKYST